MSKKIIIFFSSIGSLLLTVFWYKKFRQNQQLIRFINKNIAYTVSEAKEILKENPNQKFILMTGHLLSGYQQPSKFLKLQNKNRNSIFVDQFTILDVFHKDQQEVQLTKNTVLFNDLFDYQSKQVYQKQLADLGFKRKIPFFKKNTIYQEERSGILFGQHAIVLCEKQDKQFKALYITKDNFQNIKNHINYSWLSKWYQWIQLYYLFIFWTVALFQGFSSLSDWIKERQKINKIQDLQLEKSVSKVLVSNNDEDICIICLSKLRSVIFEPCLHLVSCQDCVKQMQKQICPLCRNNINKKINVIYQ